MSSGWTSLISKQSLIHCYFGLNQLSKKDIFTFCEWVLCYMLPCDGIHLRFPITIKNIKFLRTIQLAFIPSLVSISLMVIEKNCEQITDDENEFHWIIYIFIQNFTSYYIMVQWVYLILSLWHGHYGIHTGTKFCTFWA